jgi:hypothetical protein
MLSAIFVSIFFSSCSKKLTGTSATLDRDEIGIDMVDFDYLSIKSKIEFQEAASSVKNATALIRLKKDSVMWFNLSGTLGVQGVRGILTQDSIKMINRVEKQYYLMDYDDLSREFNFKIDFSIIQAMVLGEMPKGIQEGETISKERDRYVIHQNFGDVYIDNYISASTKKVTEVSILETPTKNSMTLLYGDFQQVNEQYFPFSSFVSLIHNNEFGELETKVDITHNKVEFSDKELKFPFTIPSRYVQK